MWNTLPDVIRKNIIGMNPSLRSIHEEKFKSCLKSISFRKHDRMCVGCVRQAIFGTDDNLYRRPSVRMYANVEAEGEVCSVRISCECSTHYNNEIRNPHIFSKKTLIPKGMELEVADIIDFVKKTNDSRNIHFVIKYNGVCEDDLNTIRRIARGCVPATFDLPTIRWERYPIQY